MSDKTIVQFYAEIAEIQKKLVAPKNQKNTFGKYNYRNAEDIMTAVKGLLGDKVLTVTHDIKLIGDRYYNEATATITDGIYSITNKAMAREDSQKKGMDLSQLSGATGSYASKYALGGLLLVDDNKDADSMDNNETDKDKEKCITESGYQVGQILEAFNASCLAELPSVSQLTETFREWYANAQQQDNQTDK